MKLIHMSDIHLTAPGRTIFGRDPLRNFERALDHVLADHRDAELMVISGDLSDLGDLADYQLLRERLSRFPIPSRCGSVSAITTIARRFSACFPNGPTRTG